MASTRRSARTPEAQVLAHIDEAVASSWAQRLSCLGDARIAVGFSGGRDSRVLLDALVRAFGALRIVALHVHHGLHEQADVWADAARSEAQAVGVEFVELRVRVDITDAGVESAARDARYDALLDVCDASNIAVLALAHHRDDQAETMLMQLARGAGLAGLASMPEWRVVRGVGLWRPLLDVSRDEIDLVVRAKALRHIDDPSNEDMRLLRNAMRARVLPAFEATRPGAVAGVARSARHLQEALALVNEVAAGDLSMLVVDGGLSIERLASLSPVRRSAALRHWLAHFGAPALPEARFDEFARQIFQAAPDRATSLLFASGRLRVSRGVVAYVENSRSHAPPKREATLQWQGEGTWKLPNWHGAFRFETGPGIPESILRSSPLVARARRGGERFRFAPDRPGRTLKQCYQQRDVPVWARDGAPLLFAGDQLLWAPGLGMNDAWPAGTGPAIRIEWQPEPEAGHAAPL